MMSSNMTIGSPFDASLQLSNQWLHELMRAIEWDDQYRAYRLLRATLHALRDCLTPQEAVQLGAQLPMLIRGLYYDGWHMTDVTRPDRDKKAFLDRVEAAFKQDPNADTEALVRMVFKLLASRISPGEIDDVKHLLRADIRALWPGKPGSDVRS
jgi:uncharacterized protein (DUF2267 family)